LAKAYDKNGSWYDVDNALANWKKVAGEGK
jgi:hypothetical protein